MNRRERIRAGGVWGALLIGMLGCAESRGAADPCWLRSWNEAQRTRPQIMTSSGRIAPTIFLRNDVRTLEGVQTLDAKLQLKRKADF